MDYVTIINLIFLIINGVFALYLFHFVFFALAGLFHKKKFPESEEKCRYGVMISCKDEEGVIGRLLESIRECDYPQEKIDIYVVAHNCTDNTAEIARALGAHVIIYNDPDTHSVAHAYHYAFPRIKNLASYDGFVFFDADNILARDYFTKLNDAFVYYKKEDTVISFRHALNMDSGVMPATYGLYFAMSCIIYAGRTNFGVTGRVTGCGFVMPAKDLLDGWNYFGITQDLEYSAAQTVKGRSIRHCDDAVFYDEQPRKIKVMWNQRLRWAKGQQLVNRDYFGKTFKALFSKEHKNKASLFVSLTLQSFPTLISVVLTLAYFICLFCAPLAGSSLSSAFLYWNNDISWFENLFVSLQTGALIILVRSLVLFLLVGYVACVALIFSGRKKYRENNKFNLFLASLVYPVFLALQFPLDLVAFFKRNVAWVKIPHGEQRPKE